MDLGGKLSGSGVVLPAVSLPEATAEPGQHSHSTPGNGVKPTIAWDGAGNDLFDGLDSGASGQPPGWVEDFLNHLGQDESKWNPNAGLRVRPTTAGHSV
jgi:hypothetical protein